LALSCRLFGVSRQSIYQRIKHQQLRTKQLEPIKAMVLRLRRYMPRLGTRKLYYLLKPEIEAAGIKIGRDALFDYLREQDLLVKAKRSYTKTTYSNHWMKKHPNLLEGLTIKQPEQVFVSDITYLESEEGVHYLSLVTDASSRKIMGHEMSRQMKASDVVKALNMAAQQRISSSALNHHSDRGSQYCSSLYQSALIKHDIKPSMTDGYDCYQNALAERINGILKQEFLLYRCKSFDDLKQLVNESIETYNNMRPHLSLGMKTPNQVHKKTSCKRQLA